MASEVAADTAAARPAPVPEAPGTAPDAVGEAPVRSPLPERPVVRRPDDVGAEPLDPESGAPRRRVRDRLARRIVAGQRSGLVRPVLEPLASLHRPSHPKADLALLQRAYDVAEAAHAAQKRKSGDPYITHPLAVATILAGLGMDTTTLIAALLHDTVEDTGVTLETITTDFGSEVAHLVDGVTKIDKVKLGDAAQAETIRKMIVAMSRDPRVLVIKLADRLHNMRTLRFLPPEKQEKKARETLEILAPLAHRLGMNTIKWELEDLAFATLYPKRYDEIVRLVAERAPSRDTYLAEVTSTVNEQLKAAKIDAVVSGRPKHYYSIYQKMIVRGRDFTDIWDLVGIRILVDSVRDCYAALGIMHAHWQPVPGRFKDFVAMPKFNMYQSLHTTVIGPQGKPVELQIRTHDMHRTAEYGIAAHWKYKEKARAGGKPSAGEFGAPPKAGSPDDMLWLRQLLDWQREAQEPGEFLETLRYDLGPQEVFVFTPKGDVVSLPGEATPVDFAFAVHTEVGYRTIGARVNGSLVSLDSKLTNGDVVEIFTSKSPTAGPSKDWLTFVGSSRARTKIRQWFTKERREDAVEAGKEALTRAMRKAGLPLQRLLGGEALSTLAKDLRFADVTALYAAVGESQLSAASVVEKLMVALGGSEGAAEDIAETAIPTRRPVARRSSGGDPGIIVHGMTDVWAKLAKCCTPVPGDDVLGFVTRGGGVSVHRTDCTNAGDLQSKPERLVEVEWASSPGSVFLVAIQVEALDRHRLLSDVTKALADERVNILSASVQTSRDRVAISRFTFELADPAHLGAVLQTVRNVEGVFDVERVTA
ncbi:RelA/SpoT family protein [Blastococcus sp. VKM Ac-2987]|uniref:RelA/SpoT family protein n=1 Tax=Blastococcus sp. VKM Ac-2987 TaxID=3004141 RepID=UPI0022ABB1D7|nr:bifunctional (p)ppGpp synthetase/guanosine-3',5'-bis(diphosphate) 3'-pyrophosphohydrolase [Blastococcus sp. VKM Ac-2987]MCZ2856958.1 bifunctional (p)ppGpp synthetase/guanosine-3',5'-bis(diphosphate) 3'-pyrophosphohydrolase [Blastococcus sp. VKM Ac-2987]